MPKNGRERSFPSGVRERKGSAGIETVTSKDRPAEKQDQRSPEKAPDDSSELIARVSSRLISVPWDQLEKAIPTGLAEIGAFLGLDCVLLGEFHGDSLHIHHAWKSRQRAELGAAAGPSISRASIPMTSTRIQNDEALFLGDVEALDRGIPDRDFYLDAGFRSVAAVPMSVGGSHIGLTAYASSEPMEDLDEPTITLLKLLAELHANALARQRIEKELGQSVQTYRMVLNVVPDLVMSHRAGEVTYMNPAGAALLESKPEELIGKDVLSLVVESEQENVRNRISENLKGEPTDSVREIFVTATGREVEVEVSARPFGKEDPPSVLVVARDISQRERAREEQRATIALLRSTLESTDDGIIAIDLDGRIQAHNNRLLEMWSLPIDSMEGKSEYEFLHPVLRLVADPDKFLKRWRDLHRDPGLIVSNTLDLVDGRTLDMLSKPQLVEGKPSGRVWSFGDVTPQKETERALEESLDRFRLLFERNLAGVYRSTVDGRILDCNAACARILGYSSKYELQAIGASEVYFDPDDRTRLLRELETRGAFTNREICFRRKDGSPVWVLESATLLEENTGGQFSQIEGTMIDISEIKRAEAALRESEERYRLMTQYSSDLIGRLTPDWTFTYVSPASTEILGYHPAELVGRSLRELVHPEDQSLFADTDEQQNEDEIRHSYRLQQRDGGWIWVESTARPILSDYTNDVVERVAVIRDVSEAREAQARIEHQAYHDPLTGLPNRMLFLDRLSVALSHANRGNRVVCVMFLDLDNFKFINDTLGHSVGDGLLKGVANRLANAVRANDTVSRMGGDEFTILSELASPDDARTLAGKILEVITEPFYVDGHELFVTTSIGVAIYPDDGEDKDTLLKSADTAMYRAKALGRNNFQLCTDELNERAIKRLNLEHDLRKGLERDELVVYYQPQVDLKDQRISGMEALVRWNHPEHGLLGPNEFIPIAEETRLIFGVGEFVLREACRQMKSWQEQGAADLRVSVNLSVRQFQHRGLTDRIRTVLQETGLSPQYLELEITESIAMQNLEWTSHVLNDLRELGVIISMDDFGTGYSSLNHLRRFPVDVLKIDRQFVADVLGDKGHSAIVSAIIQLAKGMDMRVIAEGVETEDQRRYLLEHECESMQGYLFSRPVPAQEAEALLRENRGL